MASSVLAFTLPCGSVFGTPVRVHWSLGFALPVWLYLFAGEWHLTLGEYMWAASLVACLVLSLFLHECGHLLAMRYAKLDVSKIVLHGFGGATVPRNVELHQQQLRQRKGVAIVTFMAGPITNFVLLGVMSMGRVVATAAGVEEGPILDFWHGDDLSLWFLYAGFMNFALGVYNLLPIFPLDGGHMCYYLFALCIPDRWAQYATSVSTFLMALGVIAVELTAMTSGNSSSLSLALVVTICACAVVMSCASSYDSYMQHRMRSVRKSKARVLVGDAFPGVGFTRVHSSDLDDGRTLSVELGDLRRQSANLDGSGLHTIDLNDIRLQPVDLDHCVTALAAARPPTPPLDVRARRNTSPDDVV